MQIEGLWQEETLSALRTNGCARSLGLSAGAAHRLSPKCLTHDALQKVLRWFPVPDFAIPGVLHEFIDIVRRIKVDDADNIRDLGFLCESRDP
jgi:hypothetical protein